MYGLILEGLHPNVYHFPELTRFKLLKQEVLQLSRILDIHKHTHINTYFRYLLP